MSIKTKLIISIIRLVACWTAASCCVSEAPTVKTVKCKYIEGFVRKMKALLCCRGVSSVVTVHFSGLFIKSIYFVQRRIADRRTDMTKLIIAFATALANAAKRSEFCLSSKLLSDSQKLRLTLRNFAALFVVYDLIKRNPVTLHTGTV